MNRSDKKPLKRSQDSNVGHVDTVIADDILPSENIFKRGSDPCKATCRSKLQTKRAQLNKEINKYLMLRQGADNMLRAVDSNKQIRHLVSLELQFVNSNLSVLQDQLAELNCSTETYQRQDSHIPYIPLLSFGLKETKYVNFTDSFSEFIRNHYHEHPDNYARCLQQLADTRQSVRSPKRNQEGINLLLRYCNQLYFIERRFFSDTTSHNVYFEWYDSLSGQPSIQRTPAFERASVLFNIAALHTQIAANVNRGEAADLEKAIDNYFKASAIFQYILTNFSHAPSNDLRCDVLEVFRQLVRVQAQECCAEQMLINSQNSACVKQRVHMARELANISAKYSQLRDSIASKSLQSIILLPWQQLFDIKHTHYLGLAHFMFGLALIEFEDSLQNQDIVSCLHSSQRINTNAQFVSIKYCVPANKAQKDFLGKCHLFDAVSCHEEALRLFRMSAELRRRQVLLKVLQESLHVANDLYEIACRGVSSLSQPIGAPSIVVCSCAGDACLSRRLGRAQKSCTVSAVGATDTAADCTYSSEARDSIVAAESPDTSDIIDLMALVSAPSTDLRIPDPDTEYSGSRHSIADPTADSIQPSLDLFARLGPIHVFNARHRWTAPRAITLFCCAARSPPAPSATTSTGSGSTSPHVRPADTRSRHNVQHRPLGFSIKMEAPVVVVGVEAGGQAERQGLKDGDYIMGFNGRDVRYSSHSTVVELIRSAEGDCFTLMVSSPVPCQTDTRRLTPLTENGGVEPHSPARASSTWSSSGSSSGVSSSELSAHSLTGCTDSATRGRSNYNRPRYNIRLRPAAQQPTFPDAAITSTVICTPDRYNSYERCSGNDVDARYVTNVLLQ